MKPTLGPFLVGIGSLLWATDAIVRVPAIAKSDPAFLVFVEHLIGVLALIPILLFKSGTRLFQLGGLKNWLGCAFVGAGGSAIALLLFTEAFQYLNPTLNILLQKTQPVAVVLIAQWVLGERPSRNFFKWASVVVFACVVLNIFETPMPNFSPSPSPLKGVLFSLGASFIWAVSTVTGKRLLHQVDPLIATFWRFVFGLATLCVTIVELIFPVGAILLNYHFLDTILTPLQIVFTLVLLLSVTQISLIHGDEYGTGSGAPSTEPRS